MKLKLNKQTRYILYSIKAQLETDFANLTCGPSLHSEVLGDNIEWLDFVLKEAEDRAAAKKETGNDDTEASAKASIEVWDFTEDDAGTLAKAFTRADDETYRELTEAEVQNLAKTLGWPRL